MPPDQRPNILWIVGEDCPPRFGCYGDPHARTPHLDALARRGVVFEHAFSAAPVCAPSRFALLTGVAPESNAPANHQRARAEIPGWMRTYPEILRDLGYYCTNNAKTDYNATLDPAAIWHESSPDAHWRNRPAGAPFLAVFNFDGTHESSVFTPETPEVAPAAVRVPAYLPDTPAVRGDLARHYRHIANLDAFVGELLAQLTADGLAGDTIVIHTSDHGGVHPRSKRFLYDEGLQVPLIIAAPDRFAARFPARGTRIEAAVSTIRIPPTLVDLAGGEIPGHMEGLSLAQQAFDPAAELAFGMRNRMDERPDVIRTVRDARYRYIRNYHPHRPHGRHLGFAWLAAAYQSWEEEHLAGRLDPVQDAFWRPKPGAELYDTVRDPDQVVNLAGDPNHAAVEERLAGALRAHLLAVHDNGFLPEGSPVEGYERSREPGRYPLERVLDVADAVARQDPAELPRFLRALDDADATVRRWGAIGILALGAAATDQAARLRAAVGNDPDPFVVIPAAESLARFAGDENAVAVLSGLSAATHPAPVRLEALNALTALPPERVRPFRDTVAAAADDDHEYVRGAGRYLLFQVEGTYTPQSPVFLWDRFAFTAQGAGS